MSVVSKQSVGIIHAAVFTANTAQPYINEYLSDVEVLHAGIDSVQRDNLNAPVGTIPKHNYYYFATMAKYLQEAGVDAIMLACSTFNSAVDVARPMISVPLFQIDRPMMDLAVRQGKKVGLVATLPSTVPSSETLLQKAAKDAGKEIVVKTKLCSEAFNVLRAGDTAKHNEMLLEIIRQLSKEVDSICLAQLSMSALENDVKSMPVPVYNSGRTGFEHLKNYLDSIK